MTVNGVKHDYITIGLQKREQREKLIPSEWRLKSLPPKDQIDVRGIPETCGILTSRELEITGETNDALDILRKIRDGVYTSEEVTRAFCKRAAVAQQLTNCLTEIFFSEAIQRAKDLDQKQQRGEKLGPLHGLPISIKDSFRVPGVDSTTGIVCWAFQPDIEYSAMPTLLLELGAVLYCKTNVPQTMMTGDSDNNLFGRTLNPANSNLTAGGSSGGEGALIAMRGSVLGVGTDIAGSIRIPSICNGIYGFKPSASVTPYGGQRSPAQPGMIGIAPVAGPMATSIRACSYFMKTLMEAQPWRYDPACLHLTWNSYMATERLRVGVVMDDGVGTPWPPVRRTMKETVNKLQSAGVEVIQLCLPDVGEAIGTTMRMFALDGCKFVQDLLKKSGEPEVPSVKKVNLAGIPSATLEDFYQMNVTRSRIQKVYHQLWLENRLDAIVAPGAPNTATPLDEWAASVSYTALWNFLDYPAVILPTGKVLPGDEADSLDNAKYGELDQRSYKLYTGPIDFANAPLTVQLIGMKQEDEKLLQVADKVDRILSS